MGTWPTDNRCTSLGVDPVREPPRVRAVPLAATGVEPGEPAPICGNASSQAIANLCAGLSKPASILDTVEASHGTIAPRPASVIPAASLARLTRHRKSARERHRDRGHVRQATADPLFRDLRTAPGVCVPGLSLADGRSGASQASPHLAAWLAGPEPENILSGAPGPVR